MKEDPYSSIIFLSASPASDAAPGVSLYQLLQSVGAVQQHFWH